MKRARGHVELRLMPFLHEKEKKTYKGHISEGIEILPKFIICSQNFRLLQLLFG